MFRRPFSRLTKTSSLLLFIPAVIIGILLYPGQSLTNSNGAPPGYTGSPYDGNDCSACHPHTNGMPDTVNWIATDVPPYGYDHTMMYNFSVNIPLAGIKGFEITVEDISGNQMGSVISGTNSHIVGSGKYITHMSPDSNNPGTWNFQWYPGSPGYGDAKVYGAFTLDSDKVYTQELHLTETPCTYCHGGFPSYTNLNLQLNTSYAEGTLKIWWNTWFSASISLRLCDMNGKQLIYKDNVSQQAGMNCQLLDATCLKNGIYMLTLDLHDSMLSTKVFIGR